MTHIHLELPAGISFALRCRAEDLREEARLALAAHWYSQGRLSQERAAEVAGLDRADFLLALSRMGKDVFQVDFDDLDRELARDSSAGFRPAANTNHKPEMGG